MQTNLDNFYFPKINRGIFFVFLKSSLWFSLTFMDHIADIKLICTLEMGRYQNFNRNRSRYLNFHVNRYRYWCLNFQIIFNSLTCQEPLFHMYAIYMSLIITCHLLSAQKTSKQHFSLVFPFFTPVYHWLK